MVIALMGDSCVGKSTIAALLQTKRNAELFSGKDYLRLAKSESAAEALFRKRLAEAVTGKDVIYILSETEQINFLPEGSRNILITASLESIKRRFTARMHGQLPAPVSAMLERRYGQFERERYEIKIDTEILSPEEACNEIMRRLAG